MAKDTLAQMAALAAVTKSYRSIGESLRLMSESFASLSHTLPIITARIIADVDEGTFNPRPCFGKDPNEVFGKKNSRRQK